MPGIPSEGGGLLIKGEMGTLAPAPSLSLSDLTTGGLNYEVEQPVAQMGGLGASAPIAGPASALAAAWEQSPPAGEGPPPDPDAEELAAQGNTGVTAGPTGQAVGMAPPTIAAPRGGGRPQSNVQIEGTLGGGQYQDEYQRQLEAQASAIEAQARVEMERDAQIAQAQAQANEVAAAAALEHQAVQEQGWAMSQADMAQVRQEMDSLRNRQIDPDHFWSSRGSGARVLGAISMALGAVAQSVDPRMGNPAARIIEGAIDRDIQAQQVNLEADQRAVQMRSNLIAQNLDMFQNRAGALAATRAMMLEQAALHAEEITSQYASQGRIYQGAQLAAELRQKGQLALAEMNEHQGRYRISAASADVALAVQQKLTRDATAAYAGGVGAMETAAQAGANTDVASGRVSIPLPTTARSRRVRPQAQAQAMPPQMAPTAPPGAPPTDAMAPITAAEIAPPAAPAPNGQGVPEPPPGVDWQRSHVDGRVLLRNGSPVPYSLSGRPLTDAQRMAAREVLGASQTREIGRFSLSMPAAYDRGTREARQNLYASLDAINVAQEQIDVLRREIESSSWAELAASEMFGSFSTKVKALIAPLAGVQNLGTVQKSDIEYMQDHLLPSALSFRAGAMPEILSALENYVLLRARSTVEAQGGTLRVGNSRTATAAAAAGSAPQPTGRRDSGRTNTGAAQVGPVTVDPDGTHRATVR